MTYEDYFKKCIPIHEELKRIAEQTHDMALARCADPSNKRFVDLMDRQLELHRQLADLDAQQLV